MADGGVCLAYVHSNRVSYSWHQSTMHAVLYDAGRDGHMMRGGYLAMRYGTDGLVAARNQTAEMFLKRPAEWLWWVDTDMGFEPDALYRLLEAADPVERPVVGGLCFVWRETETDGMGGFRHDAVPTIFDWQPKHGFVPRREYERDAVVQCAGTGCAMILVHRSVLERLGPDPYVRRRNPDSGKLIGEDLSFCTRLAEHGIQLHVHTGVKTSHHKELWVTERDFDGPTSGPDWLPPNVRVVAA